MSADTQKAPPGFFGQLKYAHRKRVKRIGKRAIRRLGGFIGRQSLVGDTPVMESRHFSFLQQFTDNWEAIRDEVVEILKHRDQIPPFQEVSTDQKRIAKGDNWRTFFLFGFGAKLEKNCNQAPVTASLLEGVPNLQTAWFSIVAPGYHSPPHKGVSKGILRTHLGLIIPRDAEKCRIHVGGETRVWREGEIFVFDDTFRHEVLNETPDERVILIFDFDRPMRFWGRQLNNLFISLLRRSAFYQEPKSKLKSFEDRFEAATLRASADLEKLSDPET